MLWPCLIGAVSVCIGCVCVHRGKLMKFVLLHCYNIEEMKWCLSCWYTPVYGSAFDRTGCDQGGREECV